MTTDAKKYNSLAKVQARRDELHDELLRSKEQISGTWSAIKGEKAASKGELVAGIVSKSVVAIDALLLASKVVSRCKGLFKRKKKRKR